MSRTDHIFIAVMRNQNLILDPYAAPAGNIDSGFYCPYISRLPYFVLAFILSRKRINPLISSTAAGYLASGDSVYPAETRT